ncbi:cytochrome P450 [Allofrancisella inopinata]|nr:cytochrome P450 [Allofrancisella inopinata]
MKMGYPQKKLGSRRVSLCQNEYVLQVLSDYKAYPKSKIVHKVLSPLLGDSIFTTNGDIWRFQRNIMNKSFAALQPKKTFSLMNEATENLINLINQKHKTSEIISIDSLMTYVTANIIFRTIFSIDFSYANATKLFNSFNCYQNVSYLLTDTPLKYIIYPLLKYKQNKYAKEIHSQFYPEIAKRYKNNDQHNDILGSLITKIDEKTGKKFSQKDLNEQICMLFLAGHETSATALTWALYLISQSDDLQNDLLLEINHALIDNSIQYQSLKKLPLLTAVFEETLRLYPPVVVLSRETCENVYMRDKLITPKDEIVIPIWIQHRHADKWANPIEFNPYRFYKKNTTDVCPVYMPFGKGDRVCIGSAFALQESLLVLSSIIKTFKLENLTKDVIPIGRVTLKPDKPINIRFTPR